MQIPSSTSIFGPTATKATSNTSAANAASSTSTIRNPYVCDREQAVSSPRATTWIQSNILFDGARLWKMD